MSLDMDDRALASTAAASEATEASSSNGIGDVEEKTLQLKLEGRRKVDITMFELHFLCWFYCFLKVKEKQT